MPRGRPRKYPPVARTEHSLNEEETLTFFKCEMKHAFGKLYEKAPNHVFHPFEIYCRFLVELYAKDPTANPIDLFVAHKELYKPTGRQNMKWLENVGVKRFAELLNLMNLDKVVPVESKILSSFSKGTGKEYVTYNYRISMIAKSTVNGALKGYAFTNLKDVHSVNWSPLHLEQEAFLLRLATEVGYVRGCRPRFYLFCFTEDLVWKKISLWRVNKNEKMEQAIDHRLKEMSNRLQAGIAAASHCPDTNCVFYKRCHPFEMKDNDTQFDEQDETEIQG